MPLVNLTTNLKSLKWGKDRIGGGSSNQPYIKSSIPNDITKLGKTGGPDFLVRGGTLLPSRIKDDGVRLTKMLGDTKSTNGLLFTAKQFSLSRIGVNTQAGKSSLLSLSPLPGGIYNPLSPIIQSALTPLGLYNPRNISQVKYNNTNIETSRLENFYEKHIKQKSNGGGILYSYNGGPNSIGGIGKTQIKLSSDRNRTGINNINTSESKYKDSFILPDEKYINDINKTIPFTRDNTLFGLPRSFIAATKIISTRTSEPVKVKRLNYSTLNNRIEQRFNLGNPGKRKTGGLNYETTSDILDKITSFNLYKSSTPNPNQSSELEDLIPFRIGIIQNDNPNEKVYIHFRAFLDSMSDAFTSNWDSLKYMGRGETFYKYKGFDRTINLSWTVAAQSKPELMPIYEKLNYLASSLTPYYSTEGYMGGNLATLTVGDYIKEQPGIIKSLTYTVPEESPWEIGIGIEKDKDSTVGQLPHIIRVTGFSFVPIYEFLPQIQQNTYSNDGVGVGKEIFVGRKTNVIVGEL
jgi:hypothetical protein